MTEKELFERWAAFGADSYKKSLFIECVCLCNFISDEDYYCYKHPDKATEAQFMSVLDFLHHQGCYILLYRFLRDNKDRLLFPDFKELEGIILREDIEGRLENPALREIL